MLIYFDKWNLVFDEIPFLLRRLSLFAVPKLNSAARGGERIKGFSAPTRSTALMQVALTVHEYQIRIRRIDARCIPTHIMLLLLIHKSQMQAANFPPTCSTAEISPWGTKRHFCFGSKNPDEHHKTLHSTKANKLFLHIYFFNLYAHIHKVIAYIKGNFFFNTSSQ